MHLRTLANGLLYTYKGQVTVAVILGLGFSLMFQRVCKDPNKCIVIYAPPITKVRSSVFKMDGDCYQYNAKETTCTSNAIPPAP